MTGVHETSSTELPKATLALKDRALEVAAEGITIADARLPDMPLIYANKGFEHITGYSISEVIGRNCRFLQGDKTDPETANAIRTAIREERLCLVEILNYRKDGASFWNRLSITPVRDAAGSLTHFIGVQSDITERRRAEDQLAEANRRMQNDLHAAARVQQALLPERNPSLPGLEVAWAFRPCTDLAGDTLSVVPLSDDGIGFYIIDVSGHGVPAALLSVALTHNLSPVSGRSWLLGTEQHDGQDVGATSPSQVVARLNQLFQMRPDQPQYFTMVYGILEPARGRLRYVTAGHPPIVLVPRRGAPRLLPQSGIPVGMFEGAEWQELSTEMAPGDRLYLYTDGVTESFNEEHGEFETDRLVAMLEGQRDRPLQESVEALVAAAEAWCEPEEPNDDVTILALEIRT